MFAGLPNLLTVPLGAYLGQPSSWRYLMIQLSKGAEMLGASITQAAFNMGNALGAFLGGLPNAMGCGHTAPALVGVGLAVAGAGFAYVLARVSRPAEPALSVAAGQ